MSEPTGLTPQEFVELEMVYTDFEDSCRDPIVDADQHFRQCRRFRGHVGPHASAFPYLEWDNVGDTDV